MNKRVLIADQLDENVVSIFTDVGIDCTFEPFISQEDLAEKLVDYDAVAIRSRVKIGEKEIQKAERLKIVGRAGAGVDNIDIDACTQKGIMVMNTPGGNTISTSEHTCAMILSLARHIPQAVMSMKEGAWNRKAFSGTELTGKYLGIIGMGKIGREVALRMKSFGMIILGYDPFLSTDLLKEMEIEAASVFDIYRKADFVTFHTPLNAETKHLFNHKSLEIIKPGIRIINCARGGIVEESAIVLGLEKGLVAGYATDVFETEPPDFSSQMFKRPDIIFTPHIGASTQEAQIKVGHQIAIQMIDALMEKRLSGLVNGPALQYLFEAKARPFIELGEQLGSILSQIVTGGVKKIRIEYGGDRPIQFREIIRSSILKGIFEHRVNEPANFINSENLARRYGLSVEESTGPASGGYSNTILVRFELDSDQKKEIAGSIFNESEPRIVQIDGFSMEFKPAPIMIIYENKDRPGMLAAVATKLSTEKINIGNLVLGRDEKSENALTVLSVDSRCPDAVLNEMTQISGIFAVRQIYKT